MQKSISSFFKNDYFLSHHTYNKHIFSKLIDTVASYKKILNKQEKNKMDYRHSSSFGLTIIEDSLDLRIHIRFGREDGQTCCDKNVTEQNSNERIPNINEHQPTVIHTSPFKSIKMPI